MRLVNLEGKIFGDLTVISRDIEKERVVKSKRPHWICLCSCGKQISLLSEPLLLGKAISCNYKRKLEKGEAAFNFLFRNYKNGAKVRNLEFSLSKEEFKELATKSCFYCGENPSYIARKGNDTCTYNGIDRIDNNKGYVLNNVVPCCGICNNAKKELGKDEFIKWIQKTYLNLFHGGKII